MVPPHLRRRRRDRENAWHHATEENEFFPVHNVVGFLKIKPGGIRKLRLRPSAKVTPLLLFPCDAKPGRRRDRALALVAAVTCFRRLAEKRILIFRKFPGPIY